MQQTVKIGGRSSFTTHSTTTPTQTTILAGIPLTTATGAAPVNSTESGATGTGLFAQPSNSGRHTNDTIAWMPEINIKLGYELAPNLELTFGYSFLYISDVVRPGDQIDPYISGTAVTSPPSTTAPGSTPSHSIDGSDYWAQGLEIGLLFRF